MANTLLAGDIMRFASRTCDFSAQSDDSLPQTIAGGSGAGPDWHGTSGVHTHITNTRIGDVELLERRYPVLLHRFGLRNGSGGTGKFNGGDGVVREIEFLQGLQVSILSEACLCCLIFETRSLTASLAPLATSLRSGRWRPWRNGSQYMGQATSERRRRLAH